MSLCLFQACTWHNVNKFFFWWYTTMYEYLSIMSVIYWTSTDSDLLNCGKRSTRIACCVNLPSTLVSFPTKIVKLFVRFGFWSRPSKARHVMWTIPKNPPSTMAFCVRVYVRIDCRQGDLRFSYLLLFLMNKHLACQSSGRWRTSNWNHLHTSIIQHESVFWALLWLHTSNEHNCAENHIFHDIM